MFACLGLRSIPMLCEQTKTGEDGVLTEYLHKFLRKPFINKSIKGAMKTYLITIGAVLLICLPLGIAGETNSHGAHGDQSRSTAWHQ